MLHGAHRSGSATCREMTICACTAPKWLAAFEEEIHRRVLPGDAYGHVSQYIRLASNSTRGLSARSVQTFCWSRGIHYRSNLSEGELDAVVHHFVSRVGHTYGRRSLHGLLRSEGVHVSKERLGRALSRTYPLAFSHRSHSMQRAVNPVPYCARFYGEKIHLDQNEKLVMYGVVHVVAVDGFSRKIVGFSTISIVPNGISALFYDKTYFWHARRTAIAQ